MTLQQLKYFRAMAEVLHYTQTANMLFISQSGLSYSLAELEKELGVPLFKKQGKKTVLTKYGAEFLPYAKKALDSIEEGSFRVKKMLMPDSIINLGYIYSLSFGFLPNIISEFRSQTGNNDVSFNFFQGFTSVVIHKLKKEELDIALVADTSDEQMDFLTLYEQELFAVVPKSHPLSKKNLVSVDDIKNEEFVTITERSSLRKCVDDVFSSMNIIPNIKFEAEECNAMASFVNVKLGIAIMPAIPALNSYDVATLPIEGKPFVRKINLVWVKGRLLSPITNRFRDYVSVYNFNQIF